MTNEASVLRRAISFIQAGDRARGLKWLRAATVAEPDDTNAWRWLAHATPDALEAVSALEKAATLSPTDDRVRSDLTKKRVAAGVAAARAGDRTTAMAQLQLSVQEEPGLVHAWLWLASVETGPEKVLACLRRVLALDPTNDFAGRWAARLEAKANSAASAKGLRAAEGS